MTKSLIFSTITLFFVSCQITADVTLNEALNVIQVRDCPETNPLTLPLLYALDQERGWNRVSKDPQKNTYRISADLWIGDETNLGCFMQIGTTKHPRETLIMKGSIWILPPKKSMRRTDGRKAIVNRLTLGNASNPNIQTKLLFDCDKSKKYALYVGKVWKKKRIPGGDLHVYHSDISVTEPSWEHIYDAAIPYRNLTVCLLPNDVRFVNSRLSWFGGWYGVKAENSVLENTIFEYGKVAIGNGCQKAKGCTFKHLGTAIREGGCLRGRFIDCVFEGNGYNWTLGSLSSGNLIFIDCTLEQQKKPISLKKNTMNPSQLGRSKLPVYPSCIEEKSLVVNVVDSQGKPVPEAVVQVASTNGPDGVIRAMAITDKKGRTPANILKDSLLIVTCRIQATDDSKQPKKTVYSHNITVNKSGYETALLKLETEKVSRPIKIILRHKQK